MTTPKTTRATKKRILANHTTKPMTARRPSTATRMAAAHRMSFAFFNMTEPPKTAGDFQRLKITTGRGIKEEMGRAAHVAQRAASFTSECAGNFVDKYPGGCILFPRSHLTVCQL